MKQLFAAAGPCLCAFALMAAMPSPSAAGGGYGYKHHGFGDHGFGPFGLQRHGMRHHGFRHHGHWAFPRYGHRYDPFHDGHRPYHDHRYGHGPWVLYDPPAPIYAEPEPPYATPPPPRRRPDVGCRQVREYQTHVYVGGKPVQAYGQACLQADGSWSHGVPPLVTE